MRQIDGGYDGSAEVVDGVEGISFKLEAATNSFSHSVVAQLWRNGVSCGLIYLESKEELQWLKERIDGTWKSEESIASPMKVRNVPDSPPKSPLQE